MPLVGAYIHTFCDRKLIMCGIIIGFINNLLTLKNGQFLVYFFSSDDLEDDEVADMLCSIMDTELRVTVSDGSDLEVSDLLMLLNNKFIFSYVTYVCYVITPPRGQ